MLRLLELLDVRPDSLLSLLELLKLLISLNFLLLKTKIEVFLEDKAD